MIKEEIKQLIKVENIVFKEKSKANSFYDFDGLYVNADGGFLKTIERVKKVSDLKLLPSLKVLIKVIILTITKLKKTNFHKAKVFGVLLTLPISKKIKCEIRADYFTARGFITGLYFNDANKFVIKTCSLKDNLINLIIKEAKYLDYLQKFHSDSTEVLTPKIFNYSLNKELPYFISEYVPGHNLLSISIIEKKKVSRKIFSFLFEVYDDYGVEIKGIDFHHHFKNLEKVSPLFSYNHKGKLLLGKFETLVQEDKKLPVSFIHRDLSDHNVILNERGIYLIDFGKSRKSFLVDDWDSSVYSRKDIYYDFIKRFGYDENDFYCFEDQVFIMRFIILIKVANNLKEKNVTNEKVKVIISPMIDAIYNYLRVLEV